MYKTSDFLPISKQDMEIRDYHYLDFLYIIGDAYVDHPSFGHSIISRLLESLGFKVGIISQPDYKNIESFKILGKPRYAILISSGNIDSMVNNYTASKRKRSEDSYSPGGKAGKRPDRATILYSQMARKAFPDVPIIIGGVEASLRRFAHYDYWADRVMPSILLDSGADMLIFGMGERQITEIANNFKYNKKIENMKTIKGTCYITNSVQNLSNFVVSPSYEEVLESKKEFAKAFKIQYDEQDFVMGKIVVQKHFDKFLVQNPPAKPLNRAELDKVYSLPFIRTYHQIYEPLGGVPAIKEVEFSVASSRGCFGGCSFCSLAFHQGRFVTSRSDESIINEVKGFTENKNFKGFVHDVGGPTANFRNPSCTKQSKSGICKNRQCLYPAPCKNMDISHNDYLSLLKKIREIPKVKKVFIRSGIRYDYLMADKNDSFFNELCKHHISGQLKVAPEHISNEVLKRMGKPPKEVYKKFSDKFYSINKKIGKEQYLVPYLMSSHPGSGLSEAIELAEYLRDIKYTPEQVQDFYPTPGTISTCMFYTGLDPRNMEKVYVAKTPKEKAMQRALLQYKNPKNYELVYEALTLAKRTDLIGFSKKCLIKPKQAKKLFDKKTTIK